MATHKQVRDHLGHGEGSRKVRISRAGEVSYYGSRNHTDRNHDYWHDAGTIESISAEIEREARAARPAGRPVQMEEGRAVNVYLDAVSLAKARKLGDGKVSAGIREALRRIA